MIYLLVFLCGTLVIHLEVTIRFLPCNLSSQINEYYCIQLLPNSLLEKIENYVSGLLVSVITIFIFLGTNLLYKFVDVKDLGNFFMIYFSPFSLVFQQEKAAEKKKKNDS